MIKQRKIWMIESAKRTNIQQDEDDHTIGSVQSLVESIIMNRGLSDYGPALFHPSWQDLHNPFLMNDMCEAVSRVRSALAVNEKICIYGDYDADGITATALMLSLLKNQGADVHYYIPDRLTEGYGLHMEAIHELKNQGFSLIITVDCGISSHEEAEYCRQHQIDLIITDHHEPPDILPDAYAVINPKRLDSTYPFSGLAGVGVAFKLAQALLNNEREILNPYLDLVALGTVADMVPLLDENRFLVKEGISIMNQRKRLGLKSLADCTGLSEKNMDEESIGYILGPRINAAGRVGDPKQALEMLLTTSMTYAHQAAAQLDLWNRQRQQMEMDILQQVREKIMVDQLQNDYVMVIAGIGWHAGVLGIVSSRITEEFGRPSIILTENPADGILKGSGRSIEGFDLYRALQMCHKYLLGYGGHEQAAGLKLRENTLKDFRKHMNELAHGALNQEDLLPSIHVDGEILSDHLTMETIDALEQLSPFGEGNRKPVFLGRGLTIRGTRAVGSDGAHLKLTFEQNGNRIDGIGFSLGDLNDRIRPNEIVDAVFTLAKNSWNGRESVQLMLIDLKSTQLPDNLSAGDSRLIAIDALDEAVDPDYSQYEGALPTGIAKYNLHEHRFQGDQGLYDTIVAYAARFFRSDEKFSIIVSTHEQCRHLKKLLTDQFSGEIQPYTIHLEMTDETKEKNWAEFIAGKNTTLIWTASGNYLNQSPTGLKNVIIVYPLYSNFHYMKIKEWALSSGNPVNIFYLFREEDLKSTMVLLRNIYPERQALQEIYRSVITLMSGSVDCTEVDMGLLLNKIRSASELYLMPETIVSSLQIFHELGLLDYRLEGNTIIFNAFINSSSKKELMDSPLFAWGEQMKQSYQQELLPAFA